MNYLRLVFLGFLYLNLFVAKAQKGSVSGIIVDSSTNDKIPFASVALVNEDENKPMQGTITDDEGNFTIKNVGNGTYKTVISFIGYTTDTLNVVSVSESNSKVNLGTIKLTPSLVEIEGVEVQGFANTTKRNIDRQTYRASDFETAAGGTAVDVLNKLPAISVDPDGTVSLRGTTEFMVYLNGKPTQMEASVLLGQVSANSIENIEIISVPTARFDAQGKGGIINITTKKSGLDGLSVSANGLIGGAPWGNKTDKYSGFEMNDNRSGGGLNLIYRKKDLTIFSGGNFSNRNINGSRTGDARLLQENGSYYHMVASGERPEWFKNYSANLGFDYNLSESKTLSASYFYGNRTEGRSAFYVYNNFYGDINKNPILGINPENEWLYNPNTDERYGIFNTANIDYAQKYDNKSELKLSLLYEHSELSRALDNREYAFDKPTDNYEELQEHFRQTDDTPLNGYRFSIEYEKELENENFIAVGFQPQWIMQSGSFMYDTLNVATGLWGTYSALNNTIDLSRAIYAGYIDYSGKLKKISYVAGLRLEYTDQLLKLSNPDYLNLFDSPAQSNFPVNQLDWFPTLHLQYDLNDNNEFIFAASRRINRPPTKNMAPFLYRRHYEVYEVGDPQLKPEYLTNLELSWDKKLGDQSFTLTGFYRGTDNAVFRVNTVYQEDNVLIRSYTNSGNVQALGGELNANLIAGKIAKFFIGGSVYNFNVQGDVFGYQEDNSSTNFSLKGNMNLLVAKVLKFTLDFDWRSGTVTTQGANEMRFLSNVALNYSPEKLKGWDFTAKVLDVFSSNIEALYTRAYDSSEAQIFYQDVEYDRFGPIAELSATYSFNMNGKSRKKADSTFGKEQF